MNFKAFTFIYGGLQS